MVCYNGFSSPNLDGYSLFELVFGYKMTLDQKLEIKVDTVVSGTFRDYYEKLRKISNIWEKGYKNLEVREWTC